MIVNIDEAVYDRLWEYVYATDKEIGGFGWAFEEDGEWFWEHIELPEQITTAASIEYEDNALLNVITNAAEAGVLDRPDFCWVVWHSHGKLAVSWSRTDIEDSIKVLGGDGNVTRLINFVGNHEGRYRMRADVFDVPMIGHAHTEEVFLYRPALSHVKAEVMEEISQKLRSPKPTTYKPKPTTEHPSKELVLATAGQLGFDVSDVDEFGRLHEMTTEEWQAFMSGEDWEELDGARITAAVDEDGTVYVTEGI